MDLDGKAGRSRARPSGG